MKKEKGDKLKPGRTGESKAAAIITKKLCGGGRGGGLGGGGVSDGKKKSLDKMVEGLRPLSKIKKKRIKKKLLQYETTPLKKG